MKAVLYYLALVLGAPLAFLVFRFKITYEGGQKFPLPKGAIIISNHKTFLDPIVLAYALFFRRLYFLAADWYHGFPIIFKPFMLLLGAVLVDHRGYNVNFLAKSKALLLKGHSILVFPEGDYVNNKHLYELGEFKTGYLLMAKECGAPIIPIISDFSFGLFKRVTLKIGQPIYPEFGGEDGKSKDAILKVNEEVRNKCAELLYALKREKANKVTMSYDFKEPHKGDVIRIKSTFNYHYGVYFDDEHVLEFGEAVNPLNQEINVHYTTLLKFTSGKIPEVRNVSKRKLRKLSDVDKYANEVIGKTDYSLSGNNCLDLANRLTLKI